MPRRVRASTRRGRRRRRARHPPASSSRRGARGRATSGQPCASRWCASSTGWACCRWVRPGMIAVRCASAWAASASMRWTSCWPMVAAWSLRYRRTSVAIWSLRLRPARSLPPSSAPTMSISAASRAPCTSSSVVGGDELARDHARFEGVEPGEHRGELVGVEVAGRARARGRGLGNRRCRSSRAASRSASTWSAAPVRAKARRETGAPERALVGAVLGHQASFFASSQTSSAFWACSRFSASSQMIDCAARR